MSDFVLVSYRTKEKRVLGAKTRLIPKIQMEHIEAACTLKERELHVHRNIS